MTIQDKHKKIASAKWKQARGGKAPTSDRETTKPTAAKPPTQQSRPLALANPLPSGKQNSDDDSQDDEDDDSQEGDEAGNGQASTSSPPDDTQDESSSRFGRRKLVSNQDRYEEKTDAPIPGEEDESDGEASHEIEQMTAFLARQRLALESASAGPLATADAIPDDDIDHSLRSIGATSVTRRTKEKLGVRAGEGSLVEMSAERAKADALSDVKARLLAGRDAGAKRRAGGRAEGSRAPAKATVHQADDVDDFLNMI